MKRIIFSALVIALLFSCKEKPPEIPELPIGGDRVVLVEEFSGGSCVNCSDASLVLQDLLNTYGGNLVVVTAHLWTLAQTAPSFGAKYDFRTDKGQELIEHLGLPLGLPAASVNRKLFEGEDGLQLRRDKWSSLIASELTKETKANLNLEFQFNADTRELDIDLTVIPAVDLDGEVKLTAMITESHIIDFQDTPTGTVEDWEHNHILRDFITDVKGFSIGSGLAKGIPITQSFNYTVPAEDDGLWVADNLEIVVHISENTADTREVLQAATKKFKE